MKQTTASKTTGTKLEAVDEDPRSIVQLAGWVTSVSLGAILATLQALTVDDGGLSFKITIGTGVAFAVGVVAALLYWRFAVNRFGAGKWKFMFGVMIVASVAMFLYPLRYVPSDRLPDIGIGMAAAICAVSCGAFLFFKIFKFLSAEEKRVESGDLRQRL